jgi:hypothetical protein
MFQHSLLFAAAFLAAGTAGAQVGITADAGSTGIGAHVVVPLAGTVDARFGANTFKHDFDKTSGLVDYDIKGKLQTVDALVDWHVIAGSSFRLTGGVVYNGNKFDARGKPNGAGTFTLNGHTYSAADVGILTGRIDFRKTAPYLGIGWGNELDTSARWTAGIDLGAFYQGKANVDLQSVNCAALTAACTALARDVALQRLRLADDMSDYLIYPVVRVAVGYRF